MMFGKRGLSSAPPAKPPVLVIAGPTASGKSGLALAVAQAAGGEIINADSMQVYAGLGIVTAQPDTATQTLVPHHLYGVLPPEPPCSAARWRTLAIAAITATLDGGRLPVVVGGTGLYLRALIAGLSEIPPIPPKIRAQARDKLAELGPAGLHAELSAQDQRTAARLKPGDSQRVVRAWEVLVATGRPLAEWQETPPSGSPLEPDFRIVILDPPRAALYAACDRRFAEMVKAGAVEEVRILLATRLDPDLPALRDTDLPALRALGVPELSDHLRGTISLGQAIERAQQATRNYAKRQTTWFRHQLTGHQPPPERVAAFGSAPEALQVCLDLLAGNQRHLDLRELGRY
ncbi:tRNA dimethylallyltransferase [uncultured Gammaproteobacteria bacterium]